MEPDISEALRYMGAQGASGELRERTERTARRLASALAPRYTFRAFSIRRSG